MAAAAFMAMMMLAMAVPAFAVPGNNQSSHSGNKVGEFSAATQHNGTAGVRDQGRTGTRSTEVQGLLGH